MVEEVIGFDIKNYEKSKKKCQKNARKMMKNLSFGTVNSNVLIKMINLPYIGQQGMEN